jgi:acetyltransferase-like isoleucine patch superfamily enzyme
VSREPEPRLPPELEQLRAQLRELHDRLREQTWDAYRRVNPFVENLVPWKEKGEFVGGVDVTIYDSTTVVGDVRIGDHTWIGPFCSLDGTGGLTIGSYCSVAAGTHIQTHDAWRWAVSGGRLDYEYAPVSIGDRCFIGANCVVTKGITIGEGCVVAAGAVVTTDLEPGSVAAGVPARRVGEVRADGDSITIDYLG